MARAVGNLKECCRCKETKSTNEFTKRNRALDGLEYFCKNCSRIENDKNRDQLRKADRKSYYKNRKKRIAKSSKYNYQKRCKDLPEKWSKYLQSSRKSMSHEEAIEHDRKRLREYKRKNREKLAEKYRAYIKTEQGKEVNRLKSQRYRAKQKTNGGSITQTEIDFLFKFQDEKCASCKKIFDDELQYELDHIVPVSLGGTININNIQLLCRSCNASKGANTIRFIPPLANGLLSNIMEA